MYGSLELRDFTANSKHDSKSKHGSFLVADTQLYKRLWPYVGLLVGRLVRGDRVEKWENAFLPLPTRPQLMAVYPALLTSHLHSVAL